MSAFLSMFGLGGSLFAGEGGITGGGGDPLRFYFLRGKEIAASQTENASDQLLSLATHERGSRWVKEHREELASEIRALNLSWEEPDSVHCAYTEFQPEATVRLSFQNCRTIGTPEEASKVLIHEASHHLGVRDHDLADDIALAVTESWERAKVLSVPFCPTEENYLATLLPGDWTVDLPLLRRLYPSANWRKLDQVSFQQDIRVAATFPPIGRCAVSAGYVMFKSTNRGVTRSMPAVLIEMDQNLNLIWWEGNHQDGSPDLESSIINGARAEDTRNDLLFLGGDFNSPGTFPFKRRIGAP